MSLAVVPATMHGDLIGYLTCDGEHRTPPILHPGDRVTTETLGGMVLHYCSSCAAKRRAAAKRQAKW